MSRSVTEILKNPLLLFTALGHREMLNWIDDETYLKIAFRANHGKKLHLDTPKTFSEKLQWLKLYDRNPLYTRWVDKQDAKVLAAQAIGEEYIIPTLGVWEHFDDIDFDALPDKFVLKCTHDSGGLIICKDKSRLDKAAAKAKIEKCLHHSYYWGLREWPYKNVKPRIIAEVFLEKEDGSIPEDYKIFNFNGTPKLIQVDLDRYSEHKKKLYSPEWEELDFDFNYPTDRNRHLSKPSQLLQMLELAKCLSQAMPFARTDFYLVAGKIYFGEMTFFPASGFGEFKPESWDEILGSWLTLPTEKRTQP